MGYKLRTCLAVCLIVVVAGFYGFHKVKQSHAFGGTCVGCYYNVCDPIINSNHATTRAYIGAQLAQFYGEFQLRMIEHEEIFLIVEMFTLRIQPVLMGMQEQFISAIMQQTLIIGTFFDAKIQLERQLAFQELVIEAHRDYHPDVQMCVFGTTARSLAAADMAGDLSRMTLNKRFLDRQLGNHSSVGAHNPVYDKVNTAEAPPIANRASYFLENTCDPKHLNHEPTIAAQTGLIICNTDQAAQRGWANRDINFAETIMGPRTINVDYRDNNSASDNQRVLEMSNYLYGHDVFSRIDSGAIQNQSNQENLMDVRSVIAQRSVAQNSFNALVGLKTRGTRNTDPPMGRDLSAEETAQYMQTIMAQLLGISATDSQTYYRYITQKHAASDMSGVADPEINALSYYAQLEFLAKKIYQLPEFYISLYDKPANIKRKAAAMQAVGLMLEREIFDSYLRSEAILSIILELKVHDAQQNYENLIRRM